MRFPLPLAKPITFGDAEAVHVNVVPTTLFGVSVMLMTEVCPLHATTLEAAADGDGFTVITKYTGNPLHPLKLGMMVYVTVPDTLPVFTGASAIFPDPVVVTEPALTGPAITLVHENAVPPIVAVGVKDSAFPLQIC
jgi:hypothetical protein